MSAGSLPAASAAPAAVVAAPSQQQQQSQLQQTQQLQVDSQYSRQLLLQLPPQQQQIVSPMATTPTLQVSNGSNNNIPAYLGDQVQSTDPKMDPFVAAMAAAAYTPQPVVYPSMEQYIYPTSLDPFQLASAELKDSQLASPSSTSSSSCSNYSMMMIPPTAGVAAAGSAGQIAFYAPQTEVRTTMDIVEILATPPTLRLNTPLPYPTNTPPQTKPCIMFF